MYLGRRRALYRGMTAHNARFGPPIEKVEFKVTVLPEEEQTVFRIIGEAGAAPLARTVFFYDTPDLALSEQDVFLRARTTEGEEDDSTVKLRPLPDSGVPDAWESSDGRRIEADVVGERIVTSAKLDGGPDPGEIAQVARKNRTPDKLFSKAQEALVPISVEDLAVLGPVVARVWKLPDSVFARGLAVEEWTVDGTLHFVELSFKAKIDEAAAAKQEWHAWLDAQPIGRDGDPRPKTMQVLEALAAAL
jgi:hypothetical protein